MWEKELRIGTSDWEHEDWVGGFYPNDLPDDWRLGYYSNRLKSVLVPAARVLRLAAEEIATWPEDVYPEFRFVIEIDMAELSESGALLERLKPVSANIDAWLLRCKDRPAADESVVLDAVNNLSRYYPVCFCCQGADLSADTWSRLHGLGASRCWHADTESAPQDGGNYLVTLTEETNGRSQRNILQAIADWAERQSPDTGAALFFDGAQATDAAVQARTVAELMGI